MRKRTPQAPSPAPNTLLFAVKYPHYLPSHMVVTFLFCSFCLARGSAMRRQLMAEYRVEWCWKMCSLKGWWCFSKSELPS